MCPYSGRARVRASYLHELMIYNCCNIRNLFSFHGVWLFFPLKNKQVKKFDISLLILRVISHVKYDMIMNLNIHIIEFLVYSQVIM
jgi:hypothetical protein